MKEVNTVARTATLTTQQATLHVRRQLAGKRPRIDLNKLSESDALDLCRGIFQGMTEFFATPEGQAYFEAWKEKKRLQQLEAQEGAVHE